MAELEHSRWHRLSRWSLAVLGLLVLYALSSGPVMATAFKLREATHRDEFYLVMWLYYPLFVFGPDSLLMHYLE